MATRRRARGKRTSTGTAEDKEVWITFARAALSTFRAPEDAEDSADLVDSMVGLATAAADEMLDEYLERFTKNRRWDWAEPREDEDEEDEDEDEDEDEED